MHRAFSALALCAVGITLVTPSAADQLMVNGRARTYEIDLPAAAKGPQPTLIIHRQAANFHRSKVFPYP